MVTISKLDLNRIDAKKHYAPFLSLQRLEAHRLLMAWREKHADKLRGWDAAKVIRSMRAGKLR